MVASVLSTAFWFVPATCAQTGNVLYSFAQSSTGWTPFGKLALDGSGSLYGTTLDGGSTGHGVLYKLDKTGLYTVLHSFSGGADGASPNGGVVLDVAGNLYGVTQYGGAAQLGTIYKYAPDGQFTTLHSFSGLADGARPFGELLLDASGNLYGTTYVGGSLDHGVVYRLSPGGQYTVLHTFGSADGQNPASGVIFDAAGNLCGTTVDGGSNRSGVVYRIDSSGNETVLYNFENLEDGGNPDSALLADRAGNLYGTSINGGQFGNGVAYKVDSTGKYTLLHSFDSPPEGALIFDAAGNLFGVTISGGPAYDGTIFKIDRSTRQESVVYSFSGLNGDAPGSTLLLVNGSFYGTTYSGGRNDVGVIYKFTPAP